MNGVAVGANVIFGALADVTTLEHEKLTALPFGEPISIEEDLGGDSNVLLLVRNRAMYQEGIYGVESFKKNSQDYKDLVEELKLMMD